MTPARSCQSWRCLTLWPRLSDVGLWRHPRNNTMTWCCRSTKISVLSRLTLRWPQRTTPLAQCLVGGLCASLCGVNCVFVCFVRYSKLQWVCFQMQSGRFDVPFVTVISPFFYHSSSRICAIVVTMFTVSFGNSHISFSYVSLVLILDNIR